MASLSAAQARRIALAAQGFRDPAPRTVPQRRHLRRVFDRIGLIQIDSVNVLQRAHYLPLYSRLGPYPTELLDRATYRAPRELFEYWAHEASLVPVRLHPAFRWKMAREHNWGGVRRLGRDKPGFIDWVRAEVAEKGPLTAAQIEHDVPRRSDNWGWNWSDAKIALEWLFWRGEVLVARRNGSFARVYDLAERVLPEAVRRVEAPDPDDAVRELVRVAARAMGVATEADLRDYFRLPLAAARAAVRELVDAGELTVVEVAGWGRPGYLHQEAAKPRPVRAATLVSPFDPLIWRRERVERLFDFAYRIEIYVPAHLRVHGYYVLPFLLDDRLVARVDLKADRQAGVLRCLGAWAQPAAPPRTAAALAAELHRLAGWLDLGGVEVAERGDLGTPLGREVAAVAADPAGARSRVVGRV